MNTKLLRQKILDLAIRGKLTEQLKSDGTTMDLLKQISAASKADSSHAAASHAEPRHSEFISESTSKKKPKETAKEIVPLDKASAPFEIPENWEWVRLGDVLAKITDGTHHSPVNTEIGDFLYVTAKNIKDNGVSLDGITYVSADVHNEIFARCNPEKGDVLLIKDGATTGVVTVNNIETPFSLLSSVALLKPGKFIVSWYLAFVIRSSLFNALIRSQMKGVGITRVTLTQIEKFEIPLPPLAEQQRIVSTIETAFAEITEIEKNQELLKKHIKLGRQKILDLAIRGKLTEQLKSDGTTKDLLASIAASSDVILSEAKNPGTNNPACHPERSAKGAKSKDLAKQIIPLDKASAPFEIPANWEWVKLGDLGETNIGLTYHPHEIVENGIPVLRSNNINAGKLDLSSLVRVNSRILDNQFLNTGDILICARNGSQALVGKCAIVDASANHYSFGAFMAVFRSNYNSYIYHYLCSNYFREYMFEANSTQICQLTQNMLKNAKIPLPPLAEQQRIVAAIEQTFAEFDAMEKG